MLIGKSVNIINVFALNRRASKPFVMLLAKPTQFSVRTRGQMFPFPMDCWMGG